MAHRARHRARRSARAPRRSFTYTVEIEDGVDTTAFGGDEGFARMVSETLANPKSWTHNPQFAFTRMDGTQRRARLPGVAERRR